MLLLTSTSDIVRIVTATAVSTIGVHASWADNAAGTITLGRTNSAITGATTTTVVGSPASSTQRNVKLLTISNNHASSSCFVTLQHYDGATSIDLAAVTLLAQESLVLTEEGEFYHYDATGAKYSYNGPVSPNLGIAGTLAETMPRELCTETNTTVAASGTLNMQAIYLKAGQLVSSISLSSATTAAGTPTHYFSALFDGSGLARATARIRHPRAWAANTVKTLAMGTPYRVPTSGIYYIGYFMTATTVPTLKGFTAKAATQLAGTAPILNGSSSTGLTTALPSPAAAITVQTSTFWAAVS
jgi:hypothetical protein